MLTFGSLFAGIGGFDLGLERAGMRCLWQCELDPYAVRVLEKHWPDVLRVRDVRDVSADTVPWVHVLAGGFPCQDVSGANPNAVGLAGERSGLWYEMLRIIRELRPDWVIVENVPALLARGLDVVLGGLAESGYDAEWDCIPAAAVGAPHRRDRVWIVAYPSGQRGPIGGATGDLARATGTREGEGHQRQRDGDALDDRGSDVAYADSTGRQERWRPQPVRAQQPAAERGGEGLADTSSDGRRARGPRRPVGDGRRSGGDHPRSASLACGVRHSLARTGPLGEPHGSDWWAAEPDVGRVAHGIPARVDRLRGLGNAVVPQVVEFIGRRIVDYEGGLT